MGLHWEALTVDARDPAGLARWWAQALGWELGDEEPGGVEVRPPAGGAPSLFFTRVEEEKQGKNRLHLDLSADDQDAAVEDLVAAGASRADVGQPGDAQWVVLGDPEGNELCLLEPR